MIPSPQCVHELIVGNAGREGAIALESEGRKPLTYRILAEHANQVAGDLTAVGLGRGDRIALVLPNGPEMALAYLSICSAFACAPLNPSYKASEFDFYLSDLRANAVIIQRGCSQAAASAARDRGIDVIELQPDMHGGAGTFSLSLDRAGGRDPCFSGPCDTALLLHTSGTTSRPKLVPLTHANITSSAREVVSVLRLSPNDRYLNVLPLFHVHGLGMILASMIAGSRVACTTGFDPSRFLTWLGAFSPTWYSGTPAMHQAALSMTAQTGQPPPVHLRFIRSASSPLATSVMAELERVFSCPVIEAYGMTEASHMISSNLLPPGVRKAGSVGVARGDEVAIMDVTGSLMPAGSTGEIVIRGPNVMEAYYSNPEATRSSFSEGWFRTGDAGYIDSDGYIFVSGRIKEIINRGGEKISPREVEEVLLSLPCVSQAVVFAMPSPLMGDEVGAAVVLCKGKETDERALLLALLEKLAPFKVPSRILILEDIPRGPTGKVQRIGMAERLGLISGEKTATIDLHVNSTSPRTETERRLAEIWREVLKCPPLGIDDAFLQVGGNSLLASLVLSRVRSVFGVEISLIDLFDAQTVKKMAAIIDRKLPMQSGGGS